MLMKIGFTHQEALAMPEGEAMEYMKAYTDLRTPKKEGTGKKSIVKKEVVRVFRPVKQTQLKLRTTKLLHG